MRSRLHLPLAIVLGVVIRVPFWAEALRTPVDGDTAIIGLMARHLGSGTTMWGQPYGSPVESVLAAPFVAALGPTAEALRLFYFLMGLALIPVAYLLAAELHPRAALPAAVLMACPPPYFLLLAALPPPLYPTTLVLCGTLLILAARLCERLEGGERPLPLLALWGTLAGLALWTHLMSASVIAAGAGLVLVRAGGRRALLAAAFVPLLVGSAPFWGRALDDRWAARVVSVSDRQETMREHLAEVLPALHRPLGGLLGAHVPLVADDGQHVVFAPGWVAAGLVLIYGVSLVLAASASRGLGPAGLLLGAAALAVAAFPFPLRSGPNAIRFMTPVYLPLLALAVASPLLRFGDRGARRSWILVLSLACLHLSGGGRLLASWRSHDRAAAPFLLPDLGPVRRLLEAHRIRHVYASYGPAWRLTYESGERIVASQPWNERFRHYPLPYLDEVRFAKDVAWVLTPAIPTDLPAPRAFEDRLNGIGGSWKKAEDGPAMVYYGFTPPFGPTVEPLAGARAAGDGDLSTRLDPSPTDPTTFTLQTLTPLDAVTLVAGPDGPTLLRSMDVEVSADGVTFETVARRRRREERDDLRWVNGHPQFVLDHDILAVPLGGRPVAALRVTPYLSEDPWAIAEVLLHPAQDPAHRALWDEWLDPNLSWAERRRTLAANPRRDREDWYYRSLLAVRR